MPTGDRSASRSTGGACCRRRRHRQRCLARDREPLRMTVAFVRHDLRSQPPTAFAVQQLNRMAEIGYSLASEEWGPRELVDLAERAERGGFSFALISDHFHPWIDRQGQSPFVWTVIGGIARATRRLRLGTGVTCPTMRIHPAIVAQAAATCAAMMPGRFFLGVGSGENLNEHILGD